jgi:hypothetical protein
MVGQTWAVALELILKKQEHGVGSIHGAGDGVNWHTGFGAFVDAKQILG